MVKKDELIRNIAICNIHLIKIDEYDIREYKFSYEVGEYVWICGTHGYEGVLNDGTIKYHDRDLDNILEKIKNHREDK